MKAWLSPDNAERQYKRFMNRQIKALYAELKAQLRIIRNRRNDDEQDDRDIEELTAALLLWWAMRKREVEDYVIQTFNKVNSFNDQQFRLVVRDLTGLLIPPSPSLGYTMGGVYATPDEITTLLGDNVDVYRTENYLDNIRSNWQSVQNTYYNTIIQNTVSDIKIILLNGASIALTKKVIDAQLVAKFNTVERRVNDFTERQTVRLDSQLTKERQKSFGGDDYLWDTRHDNRVRGNPSGLYPKVKPSHWARQDQIFNFNNPPEGGNPGDAEGCRCKAIMRLRLKR